MKMEVTFLEIFEMIIETTFLNNIHTLSRETLEFVVPSLIVAVVLAVFEAVS